MCKLQTSPPDAFSEEITKFDLGFTSVLISLLDKISQVRQFFKFNSGTSRGSMDPPKNYYAPSLPIPSRISLSLHIFFFTIQLARENYNEKILNILHRLDFNGFYSKALDTFRGHTAKERPNTTSSSATISYPN